MESEGCKISEVDSIDCDGIAAGKEATRLAGEKASSEVAERIAAQSAADEADAQARIPSATFPVPTAHPSPKLPPPPQPPPHHDQGAAEARQASAEKVAEDRATEASEAQRVADEKYASAFPEEAAAAAAAATAAKKQVLSLFLYNGRQQSLSFLACMAGNKVTYLLIYLPYMMAAEGGHRQGQGRQEAWLGRCGATRAGGRARARARAQVSSQGQGREARPRLRRC